MNLRRALPWLKGAVSVALFAVLVHWSGWRSIGSTLREADARWIAAGLIAGFLAMGVQTSQWQALLKAAGLRRPWHRCFSLNFVGYFFNTILPTSIGGDIVRAVLISERPTERAAAGASVVLQRLCNFPGMIVLAAIALLLTTNEVAAGRVRPIAALGVAFGAAAIAIAVSPLAPWMARWRAWQGSRVGRGWASLLQTMASFREQGGTLLVGSVRGLLFWTLVVLNQWFFMMALGVHVGVPYAAVVVTTINVITMLPVSINGYGLREAGFVTLLSVSGLATITQGVAVGLCITGQTLLMGAIGLPFWLAVQPRPEASRVEALAGRSA
jgi:uncharacterized protein (TIRG00374 family)